MNNKKETAYMFYDGECGFCQKGMKFFARNDKKQSILFTPKQGVRIKELVDEETREAFPDSVVFYSKEKILYYKSNAIAEALKEIGGFLGILGMLLSLVPRSIRDWVYMGIAKKRLEISKKIGAKCEVIPQNLKERFVE